MRRKPQTINAANVLIKDNKSHQVRKQELVVRPNMQSNTNSGPGRPLKPSSEQKVNNDGKSQQKSNKASIQKRPVTAEQDVSKNLL